MNLVMIGGFIANGWMTICTSLSYLVYNLVELLYRVFASISNVNLFSKSVFDKFTARMYSVVAILMLFILAYNLILMIINPDDKKGTGQTTKFVKEVVISLILIILLPLVFNYMAIFQKHILDSQIITKIVLGGSTGDANSDCDFSKYTSLDKLDSENISTATLKSKCEKYNDLTPSVQGAYIMNATMVGSFLYPINYNFNKCEDFIIKCDGTDLKNCDKDSNISDKKDRELCGKYFYNYKMTQYDGGIWHLLNNSYFKNMVKDDDQKILNFNYFLALVGGILALIMFASYTIMIGIRVAKLGFLELISPIPVMMRMIQKQKEAFFDKWLKELKNTYLDVFIRLIIINFALFSISLVPDVIEQLSAGGDDNLAVVLLAKFVVILGILQFAKETPDLIKEFFGGSGRFSIKKGFENWKSTSKPLGMAAGIVGGAAVGLSRNVAKGEGIYGKITSGLGGLVGGARRGAINGYKGGLLNSKQNISKTAEEVELARERHRAIRNSGEIQGKSIPLASSVVGTFKNAVGGVKEGWTDFANYMTGSVASSAVGNAANSIMDNVSSMETDFSSAAIKNIEAGRTEIMKNFNADKDFDFNGYHYHKKTNGKWADASGNEIESNKLRDLILDSFKNRIATAYGKNEMKAGIKEGYERANEVLMKNLRASLPILGSDFSNRLFESLNKLKDVNGQEMNLNIHSLDDLEKSVTTMMGTEEGRANLYKVTDEIKTVAKGMKLSNDQALKAQQAQKDKSSGNK